MGLGASVEPRLREAGALERGAGDSERTTLVSPSVDQRAQPVGRPRWLACDGLVTWACGAPLRRARRSQWPLKAFIVGRSRLTRARTASLECELAGGICTEGERHWS